MIHRSSRAFALTAVVLAAACSSSDRDRKDATGAVATPAAPVRAFVAHRDARLDSPSFVWLAKEASVRFATGHEAASATLRSIAGTFGLEEAALASVTTTSVDDTGRGPVIARLRQRHRGIEVFRGGLAIAMTRTFEPISASGLLARSLRGAEQIFSRSSKDAVNDAYRVLTGSAATFSSQGAAGDYEHFAAPGLAAPARVKKVLFPEATGVVPGYYVELQIARGPAYSFVVSASGGEVLFKNDLVRADSFSYRAYVDPATKIPLDGPQGNLAAPHPTGTPSGFKPGWLPSSLVSIANYPFSKNDPWLPADATTLAGNNVRAYPDTVAPDGIAGDTAPSTTAQNTFDYSYDAAQSPGATPTNIAAASTHLFYVTNFLHDWYYDFGFDEQAGNHQAENFGRGGVARDPLKAEVQDYSGRNNANATVPADGSSPRLQMYVFSGPSVATLQVLTPVQKPVTDAVGLAGFGNDSFDTSGTVVLAADDQGVDAADACESLTNDVSGKIVLVHRGLCSFVQKAQNAQQAGAIGIVVTNVATSAQPTVPPFMGGTTADITIPILSLALADGKALEAAVAGGTTIRMRRLLQTDLDGALDTTIVAHEWGHVISGRLISDGNGLTTNQAGGLGEGWADFSGLLLMVRADDVVSTYGAGFAGAYPNGAYATSGGGADFYFGIRRVPYSIDFTKDPLTFKHIANGTPLPPNVPISFGEDGSFNAEVHATGEVWATMLWECYAALLRDPRHTFADAQDLMKRYYAASLKLTPPDPTLLEARDAVLAAAFAVDVADYRLFWSAFARRGAGVGAEGPDKDSTTNQGVVESFFVGNDVQIIAAPLTDNVITCDHDGILDEGEVGTIALTIRNAGPDLLSNATVKLSSASAGVMFLDGDTIKLAPLKPFATTSLKVRTQIHGATPTAPIAIDVNVSDPSFDKGRVRHAVVTTRYHADEAANASTVDHVDTRSTSWIVGGDDGGGMAVQWARIASGADQSWAVPNATVPADQLLTSRKFTVDGSTFELGFRHRWSFRVSRQGGDLDGGVVELSVDSGKTWTDLADRGAVDYTSTLGTGRGDSALEGRKAYGNKSPGYPDQWISSRIKVDLKTQPASVMIRFRTASGQRFAGAPGWEIDDIELVGISSKPFWSFVEHADQCDTKGPTAFAGDSITVRSKRAVSLTGSASHPRDLPLEFHWSQVAGPAVQLTGFSSPALSFEAPEVGTQTVVLSFVLRADDGALLSPASQVDVTVVPADAVGFGAGGGGCTTSKRVAPRSEVGSVTLMATTLALLGLGVLLRRRQRRR